LHLRLIRTPLRMAYSVRRLERVIEVRAEPGPKLNPLPKRFT